MLRQLTSNSWVENNKNIKNIKNNKNIKSIKNNKNIKNIKNAKLLKNNSGKGTMQQTIWWMKARVYDAFQFYNLEKNTDDNDNKTNNNNNYNKAEESMKINTPSYSTVCNKRQHECTDQIQIPHVKPILLLEFNVCDYCAFVRAGALQKQQHLVQIHAQQWWFLKSEK